MSSRLISVCAVLPSKIGRNYENAKSLIIHERCFRFCISFQSGAWPGETTVVFNGSNEIHGKDSMDDMMKDYMKHPEAGMKSIDQMSKMMEGAKQSNDPAKMRTAIDQAQK